jgi:carboxypeptidase family protein
MNTAKRFPQIALLILAVFASGIAWAQTSNGTLVGSVTDPTGAVLTKATVTAVSPQYGLRHEVQTDSAGTYRMESLQQGTYTVQISAAGFQALTVNGVIINGSLTTTINGKLSLAPAEQTIEVQATALQTIDTQSGELGASIAPQEITELPYSSFNPAELAMTLPGVHDVPSGTNGGGYTGGVINLANENGQIFSVNGTRPRANNFLIDGQDDNDYTITGQAYQPTNYGAIQEVAILTNAYSAEYGRGGGSVTNYIYKSGTNNFHGNLWEVNQNSAFAATPPQDVIADPTFKNPYYNENTFGFDVGGPVKKDKLFLFGTAQWDITHQDVTGPPQKLPTAAGIATLQSLAPSYPNIGVLLTALGGLESPGLTGLESVPLGNGRPNVETGDFQFQNVLTKSHDESWNVRADWQITNADKLTGSAIRSTQTISPDNFANPDALPNFQTKQGGPAGIYWTQWVHTISSNLVNEMRFSFTDINFSFALTPATAAFSQANLPFIQFGSDIDFPSIGIDDNFPQGRGHHTYQYQDSLSWTSGRHTLKAGVDLTFLRLHDNLPLDTRGLITYDPGGTYNSLGNFIDDFTGATPATYGKVFGNPVLLSSANMFSLFIQDTWRVKSNLTIDAGLRYEYWGALANSLAFPAFDVGQGTGALDITNPADYADAFSFKQNPDKRNFGPRLGIAYTPHWAKRVFGDGKTVFRAGYGIFYDGLFTNITGDTAESQPNTLGGTVSGLTGRGQPNAMATVAALTPQANSLLFNDSMQSNLHNPLTQQWNANIQRELPLGMVLTLAYVGTRGEHLFARRDFNPAAGLDPNTFGYVYTNPVFTELAVLTSGGDSVYHSGQIEVERKLHNLTLRAAYTYSHYEDDTSEIFSLSNTIALPSFAQDLNNQHSDWGNSNFDQRHRFNIAYVAELPYSRRDTLLRILTDRWEWTGNATIESGTPNQVQDGFDNIFNGHSNSRPDLENPSAPLNSVGIDESDFWAFFGSPPGVYVDFSCAFFTTGPCTPHPENSYHFIIPAQTINAAGLLVGPLGNVGRNTLYGPGQIYFDTAVQRDFPVHFWKLENQTISFRAEFFNAFNHPNLYTPSYTLTDTNFNNTAITISGGRVIKLWLKYSF